MSRGSLLECVAVPLESATLDTQTKQFSKPPAGKAHVYIMRSRMDQPMTRSAITVDGKTVDDHAPMMYLMLELAPGKHVIRARNDHEYETRLLVSEGKLHAHFGGGR